MSVQEAAPVSVDTGDVCHRCDIEPATAEGILCPPCRTIVLALELDDGDYTGLLG